MSKFAYFNPQDGLVLQWIDTESHACHLPDASLLHPCTDTEWQMRDQGEMMVRDGAVQPYIAPQPAAEQLRAKQQAVIRAACDQELAALRQAYPEREVDSWPQQEREARDIALNPAAPTPLLSAIAQARSLPVEELVRRVRAKADAYAAAAGKIIGRKQALTDELDALDLSAPDAASRIFAIRWDMKPE
ncbi:hypothetical protein [Chromobacterium vaccinii]|uniref:hypothetical protein n=1 Tax=Chromobacterium piscinae TaxID=686831 RepID=UPI001C8B55B5|nr:hypothetical protein [Chromobacterium vaccinii]MBX9356759.1 hypothetical protein [Chromobacterium vaccinii]